jgi:hypothetical protein
MTRFPLMTMIVLAGSAILSGQDPQTGGWRRFGDQAQPQQNQDPSQPVDRSDSFGQQQQRPEGAAPPAAIPHAYGLPPQLTIPPGTFVTVRLNQELSSDHNQEGDVFSASLSQPIVVDGVVVAQRGQSVMGRVAEAQKAGRVQGTSRLALQLTGLTLADGSQANIQSQLVNRNGQTSVGNDVGAVATTTAVGAAIGAAADWGRGAAIGAGAGAVAGLAGVLLTRGHQTIVYPETPLTFRIDTPVTVAIARAPQAYRYVGPDEYDGPQTHIAQRRPQPAPRPYYYGPSYYPYYGYPYPYWGSGLYIGIGGGRWGHGRRWR